MLRRFHGGAGLPSSIENFAYNTRQTLFHEEKRRIAQLVAQHIPDHSSLFIDLGTTTEEVAKALSQHKDLRVITNNLNVAAVMCANPDCEVIVTGGVVRSRDRGVIGESTIEFIRQFKVDFGVIGISGIELDGTLRDFDYREVRVAEAIIEQSRKVFLVADHSKFGRQSLVRLADMAQITALFTDRPVRSEMAAVFRKRKQPSTSPTSGLRPENYVPLCRTGISCVLLCRRRCIPFAMQQILTENSVRIFSNL